MKNYTPLQLERRNGFQKYCIKILKIIQQDSLRYITPYTNEGLSTQKLTNCEIRDDKFSCQDFTEYVCFDIPRK